jgi:hypothetical protein
MEPEDLESRIFRIIAERRTDDQKPGKRRKENTLGTGFFIWRKGRKALALTCWHVVDPPSSHWPPGKVLIEYQGNIYEAVISRDRSCPDQDLAVLEVDIEYVKTVDLDPEWHRGDRVYVTGFQEQDKFAGPVGIDSSISQHNPYAHPTFKGVMQEVINFISDGIQFREGMSGAPILNLESGKVCAVETGYRPEEPGCQYRGYGIELKHLYDSWPEFKELCPPRDFDPLQERITLNKILAAYAQQTQSSRLCDVLAKQTRDLISQYGASDALARKRIAEELKQSGFLKKRKKILALLDAMTIDIMFYELKIADLVVRQTVKDVFSFLTNMIDESLTMFYWGILMFTSLRGKQERSEVREYLKEVALKALEDMDKQILAQHMLRLFGHYNSSMGLQAFKTIVKEPRIDALCSRIIRLLDKEKHSLAELRSAPDIYTSIKTMRRVNDSLVFLSEQEFAALWQAFHKQRDIIASKNPDKEEQMILLGAYTVTAQNVYGVEIDPTNKQSVVTNKMQRFSEIVAELELTTKEDIEKALQEAPWSLIASDMFEYYRMRFWDETMHCFQASCLIRTLYMQSEFFNGSFFPKIAMEKLGQTWQ